MSNVRLKASEPRSSPLTLKRLLVPSGEPLGQWKDFSPANKGGGG